MGLADRDYMKSGYNPKKDKKEQPSLIKRLKFFLWRITHSPPKTK